ncbi:hypothetical protein DKY63_30855 [Pseudomonas putida]|uniref:Uncharacterized protein n=1 Tax=Pseudomonas putida TaxID=303 RepID=A0A2Z4RSB1_PSEPU|nr:hypothetical protein [Pseudomonas putida]AWY44073.1 hypothetical protein DKY63_30855 [Pseudomonas putida]
MAHTVADVRLRSRRKSGHFGLTGRSRAQVLRLLRQRAQAVPVATKMAWADEDFDEEREYSSPVCYLDQFPDY